MVKRIQLAVGVIILALMAMMVAFNQPSASMAMDDRDWVYAVLVTEFRVPDDEASILSDAISQASETEGVPADHILAIMSLESEFDHRAVSVCHAIGYMQVRPDVWDGHQPYNIHDRYENIFAGAYVLAYYRDKFGGLNHAVPAYNVGETRYRAGDSISAQRRYIHKFERAIERIRKYPRYLDTI